MAVFVRDPNSAAAFADQFAVPVKPISNLKSEISDFDILVNATPVGMKGSLEGQSLFTADELSGVKFVYELVSHVDGTPLQHAAKAAGVPCIGGLEMLIAQGVRQFEIWTGREAPVEVMRNAILQRIGG